jgi:pantetheine-phosphate adenylyltransferase
VTTKKPSIALYAGSFDPITKGHFDVVEQALKVFDRVVIAIGRNPDKEGSRMFPWAGATLLIMTAAEERGIADRVDVKSFEGATVDFAAQIGATALIKGLRQISDFNDEFVQHAFNERMSDLPQAYFICKHEYLHVSSSSVKMLAKLGKDVSWMVDPAVERALNAR